METTNNKMSHGKIAGIVFIVLAAFQLLDVFSMLGYGISLHFLLLLILAAGFGLTGFALFTEKKDQLLLIGLALIAGYTVIRFFAGFAWHYYDAENWSYYSGYTGSINLFFMLPALIQALTAVAALFAAAVTMMDNLKQHEAMIRKFWFVPAFGMGAAYIVAVLGKILDSVGLFGWWMAYPVFVGFGALVYAVMISVGFYFMLSELGLTGAINVAVPNFSAGSGSSNGASYLGSEEEGYCGIMKHVLLLLFTFGIWQCIWIYRTTRYLNRVEGEEHRNPTTKLLLCLFVPFYLIYWTYKSAQRIDKLAAQRGVPSDLTTLCLILAILFGIIPPILMQDKMNAIVMAQGNAPAQPVYQQPVYQQPVQPVQPVTPVTPVEPVVEPVAPVQPVAPQPAAPASNVGDVDVLKKYKELYDAGILTQEEFEAKKREVLGI